jgi:hypothetical protein
MQLTIYNVGDPGTIHNGGLENTFEVLDMVLDNAAGHHQCGAGAHDNRVGLHKLQGLVLCS